jgi:hypothetical protein
MTDYLDIIERLGKAEDFDRDLDRDIGLALMGWRYEEVEGFGQMIYIPDENAYYPDHPGSLTPSITSSIDAAIALVERMLPGSYVDVSGDMQNYQWECNVVPPGSATGIGLSTTGPIAILLALFDALEEKEG